MKATNKPDTAISKEQALAMLVDEEKIHSIESCSNGLAIMGCNLTRESVISTIEKAQSIWLSDMFSSMNHNVKVIYIEVDHEEGQNYLKHLYLECKK